MKIKHFSHDDFDGLGCIIMSKHVFNEVDHEACKYKNVDNIIQEWVNAYMNCPKSEFYDIVLITDIGIKEETAELLNTLHESTIPTKVVFLDHHDTNMSLNQYKWAKVQPTKELSDGKILKTSGTSLLFTWLIESAFIPAEFDMDLYTFAETARCYDTWEWYEIGFRRPKEINDLLNILGRNAFIERFMNKLSVGLSDEEIYLLKIEDIRINRYIASKDKELEIFVTNNGHRVGVVYAEQYLSILGNELCRKHPDIDYIAMIVPGAKIVSFRTIKDDIHLGEIAKEYGGGGHPRAAGCPLDNFYLVQPTFNFLKI